MRFLVDAQLPPVLARWLVEQGHAAAHVIDRRLERDTDEAIWIHAGQSGDAIVTKDEDFATRRLLATDGPATVWIRIGNTTNPELLSRMSEHLPEILAVLTRGETRTRAPRQAAARRQP